MNNFNFKLRKKKEFTWLWIDLSLISGYSEGAQLDFIDCFRRQIESANGFILLENETSKTVDSLVDSYNEKKMIPKSLGKLYLKRALCDFFKSSINSPLIEDYKECLELFEMVYE